ncbi:olfactory receptor 5B17-like [Urocitellus parryii]
MVHKHSDLTAVSTMFSAPFLFLFATGQLLISPATLENRTEVTEFILLGLTSAPELQVALFIMMSLIYLINVVGNLRMIISILLDSHLHTPMYFSWGTCLWQISVTLQRSLPQSWLDSFQKISYNACVAQAFLFGAFGGMENLFLATMAYDRYAAVCEPLHYTTTMTTRVCACLAAGCYLGGFLNASIHVGETFSLFFFILVSYMFIFITILRMLSDTGYQKVLSTCASHLTAVSIFCGTVIFMYLQPSPSHSMDTDKVASVFYTMVIPILNPVVYSLRNKEVRSAFKKSY